MNRRTFLLSGSALAGLFLPGCGGAVSRVLFNIETKLATVFFSDGSAQDFRYSDPIADGADMKLLITKVI